MSRHRVPLVGLVIVAFVVRLGFFLDDPNLIESAGLVADHGEVARNIVVHGGVVRVQPRGTHPFARKDSPRPGCSTRPRYRR